MATLYKVSDRVTTEYQRATQWANFLGEAIERHQLPAIEIKNFRSLFNEVKSSTGNINLAWAVAADNY